MAANLGSPSSGKGRRPGKSRRKVRNSRARDEQRPSSNVWRRYPGRYGGNPYLVRRDLKLLEQTRTAVIKAFMPFKLKHHKESDGKDDEETEVHTGKDSLISCLEHRRMVCRDCFQNQLVENNVKLANAARRLRDMVLKQALEQQSEHEKSLTLPGRYDPPSETPSYNNGIAYLKNISNKLSNVEEKPTKNCAHCGNMDDLKVCSRCRVAWYCSKEHQRADYRNHKEDCLRVVDEQKITAAATSP